ncbi:hypothetical protein BDC45DRAFT_529052 [Circinella umbellata]|nr:hypothetical protein BDC45DRAFT_529052 [Circinella umbellata]
MERMDIDSADSVGDDDIEDAISIDSINSFNSNRSGFSFLKVVFPVTRGPNPRPETLAKRRERARAYLREIFPNNHRAARRHNRVVTCKCILQTILENPYLAGARQPPPGTLDMLNFIHPANVTRPVLTDQKFWENAFHLVTTLPGEALARPTSYPELDNTFTNHFNPARVQNNAYYAVPAWVPGLHAQVRRNFARKAMTKHHQAFQIAFADENAQSIIERPIYLLNQIEENGVRRWTVLPVAKHQVAYMPIDQRSLYYILKIYSIQYPNAHMPPHIMSPNLPRGRRQHRLITTTAFFALSSVQMEQIWEDISFTRDFLYFLFILLITIRTGRNNIFNLNHVTPCHCTYWETDEAGMFPSQHREWYLFNNYIETDGVRVSLTFRRPITTIHGERLPQSSREVARYPRIRSLVTALDTVDWSQYRELTNARQYVAEEALRGREATNLHLLYHIMGFVPATVTTSRNFIQYIRMIGEFHTEIYENFNFHYRHCEMRMRYFGAHYSALEMLANLLIGVDEQNDPQLPPQLPTFFRHSKKECKNHRRAVHISYSIGTSDLVILTNESYTSIMCSVCHNRTVSLVHQSRGDPDRDMWICTNHRRATGNNRKGRKILWCCDKENNPLTYTSQCPDRVRAAGYRRNVYPYRWCRHCRVIDRDLNAANNIGRVFTAYINSNGDPNSRPLYL